MKLDISHVTWSKDKKGCYYTIIFPLQAGDPCETTLHCLTHLGIGIKPGSNVRYGKCKLIYKNKGSVVSLDVRILLFGQCQIKYFHIKLVIFLVLRLEFVKINIESYDESPDQNSFQFL